MFLKHSSIICVIIVWMLAAPSFAAEDAYLKMLEGEAENLELDKSSQLTGGEQHLSVNSRHLWEKELSDGQLSAGLEQKEFEQALRQNFYGTFVFFDKLDSTDKQTIYYRYSKMAEPDLDVIRKDILGLLKQ